MRGEKGREVEAPVPPLTLPPRWRRKVIELRRMTLFAVPVGMLYGAGVAGLETVCNAVLWDHLGATPVIVRLEASRSRPSGEAPSY